MNKEAVIQQKLDLINHTQQEIESINKIELGRLYMLKELYGKDELHDTYGFFECYNTESIRFNVVASTSPKYDDSGSRRMRGNINSYGYAGLYERLTRVKKDDLPLLVGLLYASVDLEKILKGKKKIKIDG